MARESPQLNRFSVGSLICTITIDDKPVKKLEVIVNVVNDNGGIAKPSDFFIKLNGNLDIQPRSMFAKDNQESIIFKIYSEGKQNENFFIQKSDKDGNYKNIVPPGYILKNEGFCGYIQQTISEVLPPLPDNMRCTITMDDIEHFHMVSFGDSVMWGQGHEYYSEFTTLIQKQIAKIKGNDVKIHYNNYAHSGAVIGGTHSQLLLPSPTELQYLTDLYGEVPRSFPSIIQQIDSYKGNSLEVDLVLVDGCINDIEVSVLMNDRLSIAYLSDLIENYCYSDMKQVLNKIKSKFSNAKVIVTGYFPVISHKTDLDKIPWQLEYAFDIKGNTFSGDSLPVLSRNWNYFYLYSSELLKKATQEILGTDETVAIPQFKPENSIYAGDSFLWQVRGQIGENEITLDILKVASLFPSDHLILERVEACNEYYGYPDYPDPRYRGTFELFDKGQTVYFLMNTNPDYIGCLIASVAHPNDKGTQEYARVINEILDKILLY